mmetsp:Transcript_10872/g.19032  ORF Transcript_10872/g.19032 Transcript_10872/m.19032 type:complete len:238 (-) Transcript_10872:119-832(-)|eukprot:CAMPEP_0183717766 /NCGR_PEP_ID=MMETSP0737-20130205/11266_1 /TAXON_ID=385413 /ORGANISM="Thalassiosira miniscula, Strain CCMP1093" /LENGTH=237 /DNA_ID=CAMNT_0025947243 /DNA_START=101 /DNA_END=814 /DNA_ORIENTATION=-
MFSLHDFPDGLLPHIASYLPNASAAMLAVALTAPSSSPVWRQKDLHLHYQPKSQLVIAILDKHEFEELSYFDSSSSNLAKKLVDDDIRATLVCINALTTVKKLCLKGCANVHGRGIDPLHGSAVLEEIYLNDLEKPRGLAIVRTLDSILKREGGEARNSSLKEIEFPARYSDERLRLPSVNTFILEWTLEKSRRDLEISEFLAQQLDRERREYWTQERLDAWNRGEWRISGLDIIWD